MKKIYALAFSAGLLFAGSGKELRAQQQFGILKGIVADARTGETIPFASVVVKNTKGILIAGGTSNLVGDLKVDSIPIGKFTIEVSFMGYTTLTFNNFKIFEISRFSKISISSNFQDSKFFFSKF